MTNDLKSLLDGIAEGYDAKAWYGSNLSDSLARVRKEEAAWRIAPEQPNIWELALHSAYWKYVIWRKITGAKRNAFTLKGTDWYARPVAGETEAEAEARWKAEAALLAEWHSKLLSAAQTLTPERREAENLDFFLRGVAMHDVYHVGQIQQIRRLFRAEKKRTKA